MRLVYVCESDSGGIAEYALRQAPALVQSGAEVVFLCRPSFPVERLADTGVKVDAILSILPRSRSRLGKLVQQVHDRLRVAWIVCDLALKCRTDAVLMACYSEYFAPFWAPIYRRLAASGIPIATIAHDPVRDFVLGPRWWHRWSVREGYSFIRDVFVHDDTPVDFGGPKPEGIRINRIPHGPFELVRPRFGRDVLRRRCGLAPSDRVFLAFGQIRDGKNLDRFLRVMQRLPADVKLLVAGSGGGRAQRPPSFYQDLAHELGLSARCVWDLRYVPDEEIGDLFAAADFLLMTYSAKFRSASGVMNAAVHARRPILASSGPGPFKSALMMYHLGVFVPPDDDEAIYDGANTLLGAELPEARWDAYAVDHSWQENSRRVIAMFGAATQRKR